MFKQIVPNFGIKNERERESKRLRRFVKFLFYFFFVTILFFKVHSSVYAATLYVDGNLAGNCTGNYSISGRTCSGSDGNAYTDVASGVGAASTGDTLYIRAGTYTISSSINVNFSSSSTTTIQGYGSESPTIHKTTIAGALFNLGTAKNVLFKNLNLTGVQYIVDTGWTNYSGNVWTAPSQCSTQIRFNTTNGTDVGSIAAIVSANQYYCSGGTIYVYSVGNPTTTYTSPGINVADNFDAVGIGNPSVSADGNLITVDNVTFDSFAHVGVKGSWRWHVLNSKFTNIGTDGNDHDIYDFGVQSSGNESVYEYNYFGYTPGYGIHFYTAPAYAIVRYNAFNGLSGSNIGSGGVLIGGNHTNVYNNTFYGWNNGLILFRSGSQNNIIENNIFSNNTSDLGIDTGFGYPTNNLFTNNYLGSNTKCTGCSDYTGSGGPNLSTLANSPPNTNSTSAWTQFTYTFTSTGNGYLSFFNLCGGGVTPSAGIWYLDDISIIPSSGGAEKVTNGGMEGTYTGGAAPNWAVPSGSSQSTSVVHSGSSAQMINLGGGCGQRMEQYITTMTPGTYTLSGWAKRDSGSGTLPVYLPGGGNTSFTIGALGPSFLGTLPYSSATDFKIDPSSADTDASLVINSGQNLGAGYNLGLSSTSTSWPLGTVDQNSYGSSWDLGAFVYASLPATTDNVDSAWHTSSVTVTLTCSESGGSGCSHTYYTTDGTTPTASSSSGNSFTLTTDGTYTIKYFSTDTLGNQESVKTASNTVKIDKTSPANPGLSSPTGYTNNNTQPTLIFKKASDATSGIASYSVSLDSGKNKNYSTTGIPASGNGSSDYVWKDNSSVKVEFLNENDSDSSNDELHVYFKGLDSAQLSEGKHTWTVISYDNAGKSTSQSQDFYIDKTSPSISELAVANVSTVQPDQTYNLTILNRMPSFSGLATDSYQGSTVTNSNGSTDTFDKVSSGPQTITLTLKRQKDDKTYADYLTQDFSLSNIQDSSNDKKSTRFYITVPFPLVDGYYQSTIALKDNVGNTYTQPIFYLSINNNLPAPLQSLFNGNLETKITEQKMVPAQTEEEKQSVKENGYTVKIKVVDTTNKPVPGAKVTIHSKVQETTTDKDGIALFNKVEQGEHKILIAYANYKGEQNVNLTGDVKEFDLNIQVKQTNVFFTPQAMVVIGTMGLVIIGLIVLLIKSKRKE